MDAARRLALLQEGQLTADGGDIHAGGGVLLQPPFEGLPVQRWLTGSGARTAGAQQAPQGIAPRRQDAQEGQAVEPEDPGRQALQTLPDRQDLIGQGQQDPEDQQRQECDPQAEGDADQSGSARRRTHGCCLRTGRIGKGTGIIQVARPVTAWPTRRVRAGCGPTRHPEPTSHIPEPRTQNPEPRTQKGGKKRQDKARQGLVSLLLGETDNAKASGILCQPATPARFLRLP